MLFDRLKKRPPRLLQLMDKGRPRAPRDASDSEVASSLEPLMGLIASGQIPLEEIGFEPVQSVLGNLFKDTGLGLGEED